MSIATNGNKKGKYFQTSNETSHFFTAFEAAFDVSPFATWAVAQCHKCPSAFLAAHIA
jgi:hypothetical protein